jgi:glucose-6-phosphate isomerase
LGKRYDLDGAEVFVGPTPVKALGTTDQHSQVQLYAEGPHDKVVTFLEAGELRRDLALPPDYQDSSEVDYLGGKTMGTLLRAEKRATEAALTEAGRPNVTIRLPRISAHTLGQFFHLLEVATVFAGGLLGVDPLDQPGVELGKELTFGLMGRKGYEARRAQVEALDSQDPKYVVPSTECHVPLAK